MTERRQRVSKAERRDLLRKAGRVVLAVVPLVDGASAEEIVNAEEVIADFVRTWQRALQTIEPVGE